MIFKKNIPVSGFIVSAMLKINEIENGYKMEIEIDKKDIYHSLSSRWKNEGILKGLFFIARDRYTSVYIPDRFSVEFNEDSDLESDLVGLLATLDKEIKKLSNFIEYMNSTEEEERMVQIKDKTIVILDRVHPSEWELIE